MYIQCGIQEKGTGSRGFFKKESNLYEYGDYEKEEDIVSVSAPNPPKLCL
jgi:hypothetical protein